MSQKSNFFAAVAPFCAPANKAKGRLKLVLAGLVAVAAALTSSTAKAEIIAPNANETVDGVSTAFPFANTNNRFPLFVDGGVRYQQVYDASEFTTVAPGGELISGIRFRQDNTGAAFGPTVIANTTIGLSTTSAGPDGLSSTFANNVGADSQVVRSGSLTVSSGFAPGSGNTAAFDVIIDFTNPFLYNPANGNLLLDITNSDPLNNDIGVFLDSVFEGGDSVSRLVSTEGDPTAEFGVPDSDGLVTEFIFFAVPEPSALTLLTAMAGGLMTRRRRNLL